MSAKCTRVIAAASLFLISSALLCFAQPSQTLASDAQAGGQREPSTQTRRPQNTAPQHAQALTQGAFKPAKAISAADVQFPLQTTTDGIVVFDVSLNVQGEVKKVTVVQDVPPFTEAAAQSLRGWKFAAASQNGSAEDSEMLVAFVFRHAVGTTPPPPFAPIFPTEDGSQARSGFIAPGILSVQYAKYPASTIAAGAEVVQVSVNANGSADDIKVLRDMEGGFKSPALSAASAWEFQAPLQDGKPVPSRVAIAFVFSSRSLNPF